MTIDDLREAKYRSPFRPFLIRTDGSEVRVSHPDAIAWNEASGTVVCRSERAWNTIDVDEITSLEEASDPIEPPEPPPSPLQMSKDDVQAVAEFLDDSEKCGEYEQNQRLLIEILDCLRQMNDKLERLLEAQRHPR